MPGRTSVPPLIDDRYEVGEVIGRGGMATVHVGRDLRLDRRVAIKVLLPELARDISFHERFQREAQSVAALNHHSIVSVYDTGEIPAQDGEGVDRPYIVMELVRGRTLRELIHEDAIPPREAVDVVLEILDALAYSHRAGIVHRDIKPANVIATPERRIKVMDFGIARAVEDTSPALTQSHAVLGTAQYLSPEQARGESVDARSDLYSAACVLFEMLTGRTPFVGGSPVAIAAQHVRDRPPAPSELDPRLGRPVDDFMARALAKDPADRFQDAGQMRQALRELRPAVPDDLDTTRSLRPVAQQDPDTRALPPVAPAPARAAPSPAGGSAPARRRPLRAAVLALLLLVVLAVLGLVVLPWAQDRRGGTEPVVVPHVAGMDASVAETALRNARLVPRREEVYDDEVPAGDVVGTEPAADTQVEPGSTVVLDVSRGPAEVTVPGDLVGRPEAEVRGALDAAGLEAGSTSQANSAWVPRGAVVGTDPAGGSTVRSGSEVQLLVSTGRVTVPRLVGLSRQEAAAALGADTVRLRYLVVPDERTDVASGEVVDQSVDAGQSAPQGSTVTLTVAVAPEPAPAAPRPPSPPSSPPPSSPSPFPEATEDAGVGPGRNGEEDTATEPPGEERNTATAAPEEGGAGGADEEEDTGSAADGTSAAEQAAAERARAANERAAERQVRREEQQARQED